MNGARGAASGDARALGTTATAPMSGARVASTSGSEWLKDGWCWAALGSVLVLVAHSVGAPLGEPVAEDFDFLARALLSGNHTLLDGGGSQAFWRPVSHQLYYLIFGRLMLAAPWAMALVHALLMALAVWLVYRALRPAMSGPAAAVAASFPVLAESTRTVLSWPSQFVDLGLWVFTAWALYETSRGRLWRAMAALALALGSKELAVVGAALLPWVPAIGPRGIRERLRWAAGLGAVALVWGVLYVWVRRTAHLELPHHLESSAQIAQAGLLARYQWAWFNSVRAIMSLPLVKTAYEDWVWLTLAALGVVAALILAFRQAWKRRGERWQWVAWGLAWFALASATLVVIYPLWQPNRSGYGSLGLGVALAVLLELAHPVLLAVLVAIRVGAFASSPGPMAQVWSSAPETGAFMDFDHLVRLQKLMEAVRLALRHSYPTLPRGAIVAEHYAPLRSEYAFGGSRALQCWYRDSTLRWVRFEEFERDMALAPVTLVEFQPDRVPIAALVDPRAMRLVDRASHEILRSDWNGALATLRQAEALPIDPGAGITRSMIETRRALAYIGLGMMPQAEYAARQAVAEWDANPNARYWLAITLARQGRASEAESELDRSIARFPADSAATQLRDELRREVSKSR
jgi:tetratricopeptide (TPR) repeat protein